MIFRFNRIEEAPCPVVYPPVAPPLAPTKDVWVEHVEPEKKLDAVYIETERFHDAREVAHVLLGTRSIHGVALELPLLDVHRGVFYSITWTGYAANNTLERVITKLTEKEVKTKFRPK